MIYEGAFTRSGAAPGKRRGSSAAAARAGIQNSERRRRGLSKIKDSAAEEEGEGEEKTKFAGGAKS